MKGVVKMAQDGWRFCRKCFGLWFSGNPDMGVCPAGGTHLRGSGNYSLKTDSGPDQGNWRWCHKCQGLHFNGNVAKGVCPAGGAHDVAGSGNYVLQFKGVGQGNWRWCQQCQGLFFNGIPSKTVCPAWRGAQGDTQHISVGSENYTLSVTIEQGEPEVSGNALVTIKGGKETGQIGVTGSGFPPDASGHVWVAVDADVSGPNFISSGAIVTDMAGDFGFEDTKPKLPPAINPDDMWYAKATVSYPGPDADVTAIGNVFVTLL
jgi:hypothetical protein